MSAYLTAEQMAEILHVHPSTVRRWAEEEKIPAIKLPGNEDGNGRTRWRFDEDRVVTHLSTGFADPWARTGTQGIRKGART